MSKQTTTADRPKPLIMSHFHPSVMQSNEYSARNGGRRLRRQKNTLPLQAAAQSFLWNDDRIPRLQRCVERVSHQQSLLRADDGAVGSDHEDRLLVCQRGRPACLAEVPLRALA